MLQFITRRNQIRPARLASGLLLAAAALLAAAPPASAQLFTPERDMLNRLMQGASGNDPAARAFNQGRDLINDEKWDGAAATFSRFVTEFPADKNADAALYWLGFAYEKQNKLAEAEAALTRLIERHPGSSWAGDARTLRLRVKAKRDPQSIAVPDDATDEVKVVTLQALCQHDRPRCPSLISDVLRSSTASPRVKEAAITLLGRYGGAEAVPSLIQMARNESNEKLRMRAIAALGSTNDERGLDVLREVAMSPAYADESPADSAIHALSSHESPRAVGILGDVIVNGRNLAARQHAVSLLSRRGGEPVVDELLRIYDAVPDVSIRKYVVAGFGNRKSPRAGAKLAEVARTATDVELRKQAIHAIPNRGQDAQSLDLILSLYDGESNPELKSYLLEALSRYDDRRALQKLMQVARNASEPLERRKRAVNALSRSKDPEVIDFLMGMLK